MKNRLTLQIFGILLFALCGSLLTVNAAPGDLDTTFAATGFVRDASAAGSNDQIVETKIQPDGKIVTIGAIYYGEKEVDRSQLYACSLARYNPDGSLDTSFDGDGKTLIPMGVQFNCNDFAIQTDGKIVIAGSTSTVGYNFVVIRLNADGSLDNSFGGDGILVTSFNHGSLALGVAIQADGKIVVCGVDGNDIGVARYNPDGTLDNSFDGDGKVSTDFNGLTDQVRTVAIQTDGKIVVAGNTVGTSNDFAFVRYNSDGSLDTSFDGDGKASIDIQGGNDNAEKIVLQADGKIVAGGTSFNAGFYSAIVRLNADGSVDNSFDGDGRLRNGPNVIFGNLAVQTDGKIVAAGSLDGANEDQIILLRYNTDGTPDNSFDGDGKVLTLVLTTATANGMAIQADGKIVAAGSASNRDYLSSELALVRYHANGSLDTSFDGDGKVTTNFRSLKINANAVTLQPDGKILAVGMGIRITDGMSEQFTIYRYNADGTPDASFDGDGKAILNLSSNENSAFAVAVQPDGKIVIAGKYYQDAAIVRLNANGTSDASFGSNGIKIETADVAGGEPSITAITILPDGKILAAGGAVNNFTFGMDFTLFRYNADGSRDTTFDGDGKVQTDFTTTFFLRDFITSMAIQPDGKIVASGVAGGPRLSTDVTSSNFAIVRYNADGTLDTSFDGDGKATTELSAGNDVAKALALQADGKIVVAGGSGDDSALVRYNADGTLDTSFDGDGKVKIAISNFFDTATGIVIQTDGKIVTSGYANNISRNDSFPSNTDMVLTRYNPNGSLDGAFAGNGKAIFDFTYNDRANAVALDSAGRFVLAGETDGLFTVARVLGGGAAQIPSASPFDFDGDGLTDISIFRSSNGQWWYQKSSNGQVLAAQFGTLTDKIVPADYTGDGKADIAIWRPASGEWFILRSEDGSFYSVPFGVSTDIPAPADFDADGKADIAVFRPSSGTWFISKSSGGTDIINFGQTGDVPVTGDYDGDGRADIAIYRPSSGQWWLNRSTAGVVAAAFGTSTDKPVPGDYSGDGKTDIAFYRSATGEWFILRSEDSSFYSVPFGAAGDVPAPGDYDGDGKFDTAIFRPAGSTWYVQRSTAGLLIQQFGVSTDTPVPSAFVP
jgi:uncharacterized delta-60 repeat protein